MAGRHRRGNGRDRHAGSREDGADGSFTRSFTPTQTTAPPLQTPAAALHSAYPWSASTSNYTRSQPPATSSSSGTVLTFTPIQPRGPTPFRQTTYTSTQPVAVSSSQTTFPPSQPAALTTSHQATSTPTFTAVAAPLAAAASQPGQSPSSSRRGYTRFPDLARPSDPLVSSASSQKAAPVHVPVTSVPTHTTIAAASTASVPLAPTTASTVATGGPSKPGRSSGSGVDRPGPSTVPAQPLPPVASLRVAIEGALLGSVDLHVFRQHVEAYVTTVAKAGDIVRDLEHAVGLLLQSLFPGLSLSLSTL